MFALRIVVVAAVTVLTDALAAIAASSAIDGQWSAEFETEVGVQKYVYTFKAEDGKVTGRAESNLCQSEIAEGKLEGDTLTFTETLVFQGFPLKVTYRGTVADDEIKFVRNVADYANESFVAKRKAAEPAKP